MKLRYSDQGTKEASEALFNYLTDHFTVMIKYLHDKEAFISCEAIENQLASVRKQYFKLVKDGKFLIGWN